LKPTTTTSITTTTKTTTITLPRVEKEENVEINASDSEDEDDEDEEWDVEKGNIAIQATTFPDPLDPPHPPFGLRPDQRAPPSSSSLLKDS
jgi:hypothetical protein